MCYWDYLLKKGNKTKQLEQFFQLLSCGSETTEEEDSHEATLLFLACSGSLTSRLAVFFLIKVKKSEKKTHCIYFFPKNIDL